MKRILCSIAGLLLFAPMLAQAAEGFVIADISLQAGPDPEYPSIVELSAGTPVSIQGCIDGWSWCDVEVGGDRGWVPGTFLEEDYGGQRVVVIDYGPRIGIPVVSFSIGLYWDRYYHSRPFYAQREQWVARPIQPKAPPRPAAAIARSGQAPQQRSTSTMTARTQAPAATTRSESTATTTRKESAPASKRVARTTPVQTQTAQPKPTPRTNEAPVESKPQRHAQATPPAANAQNAARSEQRKGEPKPKDELKKPKSKDEHSGDEGH